MQVEQVEVAALGEAMVRLTPPGTARLESATLLQVDVGGAELNVLAGLARLRHQTTWLSRLPSNALGRLVATRARAAGVGTDRLSWLADSRVGLYFLEEGAAPRASTVVYDRRDSAFSTLTADDIDPAAFAGLRYFHVSGITPALSPGCYEATLAALRASRESGCAISFDPNFRANLWSVAVARAAYQTILPYVDVLFASREALATFFDATAQDDLAAAKEVAERWGIGTVALTERLQRGARACTLSARALVNGEDLRAPDYDVEIVDRLGGGDAFAAGFLHGLLIGDPGTAIRFGAALGALQHTTPGDFPIVTFDEVSELAAAGTSSMRIRR